MIYMNWKESQQYINDHKRYLVYATGLFLAPVLMGYFYAAYAPQEIDILLQSFKQSLGSLVDLPPLHLALVIFLNNSIKTAAMVLLGGILGIYPTLSLIGNGYLIGIIGYIAQAKAGWVLFAASIIPHGIIELPLVILSGAIGLRLGHRTTKRLLGNREIDLKRDYRVALRWIMLIITPLLFVAAFIEAFITPIIISLFI
jgi:stage II sporulation protein M